MYSILTTALSSSCCSATNITIPGQQLVSPAAARARKLLGVGYAYVANGRYDRASCACLGKGLKLVAGICRFCPSLV